MFDFLYKLLSNKQFLRGKRQSRAAQDLAMSDFSLTLELRLKTSKIINDMAKVSIKSEKINPFGGIIYVREHFSVTSAPLSTKCWVRGWLNGIEISRVSRKIVPRTRVG